MGMTKLFVYGTLMKGEANHSLMNGATYIGKFKTQDKWGLINLGYFPALVPHTIEVEGELYEVDNDMLTRIDRLEGVDAGMYQRRTINIYDMETGEHVEADTYIWNSNGHKNSLKLRRWGDFKNV
tara:strand:- start:2735 stop:3109 length:375 start_codon:yes stop_codon:yes gene_type:complete